MRSQCTQHAAQIASIHALPANERPAAYEKLLNTIASQQSDPPTLEQDLTAWLVSVIAPDDVQVRDAPLPTSDSLSISAVRTILSGFIKKLGELHNAELRATVSQQAINFIQPRATAFEEQDIALKLLQADAHEQEEDWRASAQVLATIRTDSTSRNVTETDRARVWIRIARCYLEDDDPVSSSSWVNRIKNILHLVDDRIVTLQFELCQARILDNQRQFLDASNAYHTVSFNTTVDEEDRMQTLAAAFSCAILAPAGPQRSRVLARLYKDERASRVPSFPILEKIFLDRLLDPREVDEFAQSLPEHQLAVTSDGSTVLKRAVIEHNLLAASKLYRNIGVQQLGTLLDVSGDSAEEYAAHMIEQGRIGGYIDQIDGVIFFVDAASGADESRDVKQTTGASSELRRWDANVQGLAEEVERVTTLIQNVAPDFYSAHMVA